MGLLIPDHELAASVSHGEESTPVVERESCDRTPHGVMRDDQARPAGDAPHGDGPAGVADGDFLAARGSVGDLGDGRPVGAEDGGERALSRNAQSLRRPCGVGAMS